MPGFKAYKSVYLLIIFQLITLFAFGQHTGRRFMVQTGAAPANRGGAVPATTYGQVSTFAGSSYISYFLTATRVAIDKNGSVYVANYGTNNIIKPSPGGTYSQSAGNASTFSSLVNDLKPSIITLPLQQPGMLDPSNNYDPKGTSTNNETPITYTSSNPDVAIITPEGLVHLIAPGVTIITAHQKGNEHYQDADPVSQTLTVTEYLEVYLPPISTKTACNADFNANGQVADSKIPVAYTSSNTAVATISNDGTIHITGVGSTTITLSQTGTPPLYVSAVPQSQVLTVTLPVLPGISIASHYDSPCQGSPVTFTATASNGGSKPTYQWQVNGKNAGTNSATFISSTLADGDKVTCIYTNNDDACIAGYATTSNTETVSLITPSSPKVSIGASIDYVFPGTGITFTATVTGANGQVKYQWQVNGRNAGTDSPTFSSAQFTDGDVVICDITPDAPCSTPSGSQQLQVHLVDKLIVPNTFTPNADGKNDTWRISGIASYPNCVISIYSRFGTQVYQSKGYPTPWDGTSNGKPLPAATYYYVIDMNFKGQKVSGYVTIIR